MKAPQVNAAIRAIPQIEVAERNPEAAFREYIQTAQLSEHEWQALFIYALKLKRARHDLARAAGGNHA
ncbi:hypothetical protein FBY03_111136 [Pseudomonas sp. SJZ079]|uniref:hypothetical protein n=1 Tax=Pseudomonas sp. SJZ079 TaxID=2572887 RepID=UPI00119B9ADF|nr:hypothetical protein [Pseudomonas sp. SJZ079]TWC35088.1 hypothetical protein FBY03_111136 [Pseudomonas sp. SJZ079]